VEKIQAYVHDLVSNNTHDAHIIMKRTQMFKKCMLGIGLQKQYCTVENKISKSRNELYKEQAKNNAILNINCKSEILTWTCLKLNDHSLAIWARLSSLLLNEERVMNLQIFSPMTDDNQES
jgi:hypothetical protein